MVVTRALHLLVSNVVKEHDNGIINVNSADSKPTLAKLMLLKTSDRKKIKVIDGVAPCWNRFGILLEFDDNGVQVDKIDKKHRGDPDSCCQAMFQHWLNGNGRGPHTWRTLIELLEDSDHEVLAGEIQNALVK